jgi:transaldolase
MNPLIRLQVLGQSVWLDFLSRDLIQSGGLAKLIKDDGLSGITSNPAIFQKAIGDSVDYDADIQRLAHEGKVAAQIYEELVLEDIREASDLLRPIFDRSGGVDGFVSLEVSPLLAQDTDATIRETERLWGGSGPQKCLHQDSCHA